MIFFILLFSFPHLNANRSSSSADNGVHCSDFRATSGRCPATDTGATEVGFNAYPAHIYLYSGAVPWAYDPFVGVPAQKNRTFFRDTIQFSRRISAVVTPFLSAYETLKVTMSQLARSTLWDSQGLIQASEVQRRLRDLLFLPRSLCLPRAYSSGSLNHFYIGVKFWLNFALRWAVTSFRNLQRG